jgi:hypothetical protein
MYAKIHKEMAFQVLSDCPKPSVLEFLLKGIAKPEWDKDIVTKRKWLKEWMDMPDDNKHSSKMKNDHSYKLNKIDKGFRIAFAKATDDQATVIARLKYSARDVKEWKIEEEYRCCALELAKSIHWVIDSSSPAHVIAGWSNDDHSKLEEDFDQVWKTYYDKSLVKFGRKDEIQDIYRWAKKRIEEKYDRNLGLKQMYESGGSIKKGQGQAVGKEVLQEVAQNIADYLAYIDRMIDFDKVSAKLP